MERVRTNFGDWESWKVWLAAAGSTGLTLSNINAALTTLVLIGSVIYTWRKALRKPKDDDRDREGGL